MKKRKEQKPQERSVILTIRSPRGKDTLEAWRFWEIVGALQAHGAQRQAAYDAAKWATRQKADGIMPFGEITMEVTVSDTGDRR